jgi:hypothetical protein
MAQTKSNSASIVISSLLTIALALLSFDASRHPLSAQEVAKDKSVSPGPSTIPNGMGRLYIFREVRSFGAHIDDDVTIDGVPVARLGPGMGFFCDVRPGSYEVSVLRHKSESLKLSVESGQSQYVCVMLHKLGGGAPRSGAITSDQSFEVHQLEPDYGAKRIREYRLVPVTCRPP